jgi:hypothetical protein
MSWKKLAGAALGFALAPATGGLSLKLAATGLGATLGGAFDEATGGGASGAARDAAQTANAAADRDLALRTRMYEEDVARQEPWRKAGVTALNKLTPLATEYTPFGMQQFQQDPGYAFRMSEGMKGLERSAAARGGLLSGGMLKGIQRYGQDMASQEYQNAFNRYGVERERRLNPLQSLAGVGQTATNQLGAAGREYGSSAGSIMSGQGINSANALLAGQQARSSSYGELGSALGKYLGAGGSFGGGGGGTFQADPGAYAFGTQYWE